MDVGCFYLLHASELVPPGDRTPSLLKMRHGIDLDDGAHSVLPGKASDGRPLGNGYIGDSCSLLANSNVEVRHDLHVELPSTIAVRR